MSRRHILLFALAVVLATGPVAANPVQLLSVTSRQIGFGGEPSISGDGRYVAFVSSSPNLAPGQTDLFIKPDVFLWDRITGAVTLVSHAFTSSAQAGNDTSNGPAISADGRFVVFRSMATDLVAGQIDGAGGTSDIFLWDRLTGTTLLVSHLPGFPSRAANGSSFDCALSADGRYVTFTSVATDLTAGQGSSSDNNVFLFDRLSGANILVSHTAGTVSAQPSAGSYSPSISADGSFVVFSSYATELVAGAVYPVPGEHVFLFDRATGLNTLVSRSSASAGTAANNSATGPRISGDGDWIVFESTATDLVAGQIDAPFSADVFLYQRSTGGVQLVSRAAGTTATTAPESTDPSISTDGSSIVYSSTATNVVAGQVDVNKASDVFLFDRVTGTNRLVSRSAASPTETANGSSLAPSITSDGSRTAFSSWATNQIAGTTDEADTADVFLWDRATGSMTLVSHVAGQPLSGAGISNVLVAVSNNGSYLAFTSNAANLTEESDTNDGDDVFLRDHASGLTAAVSFSQPLHPAAAGGFLFGVQPHAQLDAEGRYAVFNSRSTGFGQQQDGDQTLDVFVADRLTGAIQLVSRSAVSAGQTGNAPSSGTGISADGRWIVFFSQATDLVAGQVDLPDSADVFLFDRVAGSMTLVSRTPASPLAAAGSCRPDSLSADGRFVAFTCESTGLVDGQEDSNGTSDVFLYDRVTGTVTLISHASDSAIRTGNNISFLPVISADGRFVAYLSKATDLVPGQVDPISAYDLFLYDRLGGGTVLVTHANGSPVTAANCGVRPPALSSDGSWISFECSATNLVPGGGGSPALNVFLFERSTGVVTLVSRSASSPSLPGNDFSIDVRLSADGRWVAFLSQATDLVPGQSDTAGTPDVFLHDRQEGTTVLVSHAADSPTTAAEGGRPLLSTDGTRVAFPSRGTHLVEGQIDVNQSVDFFVYHRPSGATELVTHVPFSPLATGGETGIYGGIEALSEDGGVVLFVSFAEDLAAGDYNTQGDLFAHLSLIGDRAPQDFYTLPPCRLLDTRLPQDGPALVSGVVEVFALAGACGAPATARALAVNVSVVQATGSGYLTFYPGAGTRPTSSTINFKPLEARSNNAILALAANGSGTLAVYPFVGGGGTVHLILDIAGYFE